MKFANFFLLSSIALFLFACRPASMDSGRTTTSWYSEPHRPQFHFSPDSMWMNDPNGMVYYAGEYHLFYQHHPHSNVWGPMHWGHAVSPDMLHWKHLPIALFPDTLGTIFSGSAVIDWGNRSGLGASHTPPMVAIFTYHNQELREAGSKKFQYQGLAFSLDKGRTWTKYEGNPVLENPGIPDFRDPKVIWMEAQKKWIMVFAAHDRIMFYSSRNLLEWIKESEFFDEKGPGEGVWECPDFFSLKDGELEKWVLVISIGSGGPNGGSGTKYYVGDFDGQTFRDINEPAGPQWLEYGRDNYAGVTWSDIPAEDGRRLFLGWMSNWAYATHVPTEKWRSAMTLPRALQLSQTGGRYHLVTHPVKEIEALRLKKIEIGEMEVTDTITLKGMAEMTPSQYELDLVFQIPNNASSGHSTGFGFILVNDAGQQLPLGIDLTNGEVYVDRTRAGKSAFSTNFAGVHKAPYQPGLNEVRFHAFIDRSSVELFIDNGKMVLTEIYFPDEDFSSIRLFSENGPVQLKKGTLFSLEGTW